MPDTAPIPLVPDDGGDHALLQLGEEHGVLLEAYRALCRTQPIADEPLDRLTQALTELEGWAARLPAYSAAGLLVRLRVLWAALDHTDASLFRPPGPEAGIVHRLVWGALDDARRLAGRGAPRDRPFTRRTASGPPPTALPAARRTRRPIPSGG
ncbi:hypothetical protein [Azospirillum sp. TSO35-2]|uniref:hypothetical protein n=1 Tax=Azospirillum sp. TSO35-2 TaxID=716796 RepID=UPI000D6043BB|nr:hypothetical protein [Azospirillum sp. TSO35-2]PWC40956.1 hypothetical protein TSO352_00465 [Azospirillum sp. TSO35-2]